MIIKKIKKKALAKVEEVSKECKALKIAKDQSDEESIGKKKKKSVLSKLNKDISQLKASYEVIKKELAKETYEKESIARSINEKCSTL